MTGKTSPEIMAMLADVLLEVEPGEAVKAEKERNLMARYIEMDSTMACLLKNLEAHKSTNRQFYKGFREACRLLEGCSTTDVTRVVHGEWLPMFDGSVYHLCSVCVAKNEHGLTSYCPDCGAKMDMEGTA